MQNFIQKQIIFSILLSAAAVVCPSAPEGYFSTPPSILYTTVASMQQRPASPSPRPKVENGCKVYIDSNGTRFPSFEAWKLRRAAVSPNNSERNGISPDANKLYRYLCFNANVKEPVVISPAEPRTPHNTPEDTPRIDITQLARTVNNSPEGQEACRQDACQKKEAKRIKEQRCQLTVAENSMRAVATEGLEILSGLINDATRKARTLNNSPEEQEADRQDACKEKEAKRIKEQRYQLTEAEDSMRAVANDAKRKARAIKNPRQPL